VEYKINGAATYTTSANLSTSYFSLPTLNANSYHYFLIYAHTNSGNSSPYLYTYFHTEAVPAAPSRVAVELVSVYDRLTRKNYDTFRVTWTDNSNVEEGFYINAGIEGTKGFVYSPDVATVSADVEVFTLPRAAYDSIDGGSTLIFRVRSFNSAGISSYVYSNEITKK